MKRKVLVIGALGRIGSSVAPTLFEEFDVRLIDCKSGTLCGQPVEAVDITDYNAISSAMEGVDCVIHLAIASARAIFGSDTKYEREFGDEYRQYSNACIDVNVRGTFNIFEAARVHGVKRIVYASSLTVLMGAKAPTTNDDMPRTPSNFYSVTKLWGEELGALYSRVHGMEVICLRLGTPHPQPQAEKYQQWLKSPAGKRTFVTYEDLAGAFRQALVAEGVKYGAYTVVSDAEGMIYRFEKAQEFGWQPQHVVHQDGTYTLRETGSGQA